MAGLDFSQYKITSQFNPNGGHKGLDFATPSGTKVQTPVSGTISKVQKLTDSYGYNVRIVDDEGNTHYFAHLSGFGDIKPGQKVSAGTVIGYSGSTGNSTGPHLHYEVRRGNNYNDQIDPDRYISGYTGGAASVNVSQENQGTIFESEAPKQEQKYIKLPSLSELKAKLPSLTAQHDVTQPYKFGKFEPLPAEVFDAPDIEAARQRAVDSANALTQIAYTPSNYVYKSRRDKEKESILRGEKQDPYKPSSGVDPKVAAAIQKWKADNNNPTALPSVKNSLTNDVAGATKTVVDAQRMRDGAGAALNQWLNENGNPTAIPTIGEFVSKGPAKAAEDAAKNQQNITNIINHYKSQGLTTIPADLSKLKDYTPFVIEQPERTSLLPVRNPLQYRNNASVSQPLPFMSQGFSDVAKEVQKKYGLSYADAVTKTATTPYGDLMGEDKDKIPLVLNDGTDYGSVTREGMEAILQGRASTYMPQTNWEYQTLKKYIPYEKEKKNEYIQQQFDKYAEMGAQSIFNPYTNLDSQKGKLIQNTRLDGGIVLMYQYSATPEEKKYINYLYGRYSPNEADKLANEYWNNRVWDNAKQIIDRGGVEGWVAKNITAPAINTMATLASPVYGAEVIGNTIKNIIFSTDDPVSQHSRGSQIMKTQQTSGELFTRNDSDVAAWFKNVGLSVVQNVVNYGLFQAASPAMMAIQAGAQSAYEAGQQGGNGYQQLAKGVWGGLSEYFGEKVSFKGVKGLTEGTETGIKGVLQGIGKQAVKEFGEESATEISNIIGDMIIMSNEWGTGSKSNYDDYIQNYLSTHKDDSEAKAKLSFAANAVGQVLLAGAAGAISGVTMGSGATALGYRQTNNQILQTNENIRRAQNTIAENNRMVQESIRTPGLEQNEKLAIYKEAQSQNKALTDYITDQKDRIQLLERAKVGNADENERARNKTLTDLKPNYYDRTAGLFTSTDIEAARNFVRIDDAGDGQVRVTNYMGETQTKPESILESRYVKIDESDPIRALRDLVYTGEQSVYDGVTSPQVRELEDNMVAHGISNYGRERISSQFKNTAAGLRNAGKDVASVVKSVDIQNNQAEAVLKQRFQNANGAKNGALYSWILNLSTRPDAKIQERFLATAAKSYMTSLFQSDRVSEKAIKQGLKRAGNVTDPAAASKYMLQYATTGKTDIGIEKAPGFVKTTHEFKNFVNGIVRRAAMENGRIWGQKSAGFQMDAMAFIQSDEIQPSASNSTPSNDNTNFDPRPTNRQTSEVAAQGDSEQKINNDFIKHNFVLANPTKAIQKAASDLGDILKTEIIFVAPTTSSGSKYNGFMYDGKIYVSTKADDPDLVVIGHEFIHRMRSTNPETYNQFKNVVINEIDLGEAKSWIKDTKEKLLSENSSVSAAELSDQMLEELVADIAGQMFNDPALIEEIAVGNQTFKDKLITLVHKIINDIVNAFRKGTKNNIELERIVKNLEKVRDSLIQSAVESTTEYGETNSEDIKFSRKKSFAEQVDEVLDETKNFVTTHLYLGETPQALLDLGLPKLPLLATAKHIYTIAKDNGKYKNVNYHGLGAELVKQLPDAIAHPVMTMVSENNKDSYIILTELIDKSQNPVIAAVLMNGKGYLEDVKISANIMTSAYGKENINRFIKKAFSQNRILQFDKKRSQQLFQSPRVQFPDNLDNFDFIGNRESHNVPGIQYSNEAMSSDSNNSIRKNRENVNNEPNKTGEGDIKASKKHDLIPMQDEFTGVTDDEAVRLEQELTADLQDVNINRYFELIDMEGDLHDSNYLKRSYNFTDVYRNFRSFFGKHFDHFEKVLLRPFDKAKGDYAREVHKNLGEMKREIVDQFQIRKGSKESAAVQWIGEGERLVREDEMIDTKTQKKIIVPVYEPYTEEVLKEEFGDKRAEEIKKAAQWFRSKYDTLIDQINESRSQIYAIDIQKLNHLTDSLNKVNEQIYDIEKGRVEYTVTQKNDMARIRGINQQIVKIKDVANDTVRGINRSIADAKTKMKAKKNKSTQVYFALERRLAGLEARKKRISDSAHNSVDRLQQQIDKINRGFPTYEERIADERMKKLDQLKSKKHEIEYVLKYENPRREKLIPKRKDYFRHFQELDKGITAFKNILAGDFSIDPKLSLISEETNPKSKWQSFAQRRTGKAREADAVGGFLNYIPSAEYAIHIDPFISQFRTLARDLAQVKKDGSANGFIIYLNKFANQLAGKTFSYLDRAIINSFNGNGRKILKAANFFNNKVKGNAVMWNLSSVAAQPANLINGIAKIKDPVDLAKGFIQTIGGFLRSDEVLGRYGESDFLAERFLDKAYSQFDQKLIEQPNKFAGWLLGAADEIGTRVIWNSAYNNAMRKGVTDPAVYADNMTRSLVAGRGIGETPLALSSSVGKMVAPFCIEVQNNWHILKDMGGDKDIVGIFMILILNWMYNMLMDKLGRSKAALDPIGAVIEGYNSGEKASEKVATIVQNLAGEIVSNIPGNQMVTAFIGENARKALFGNNLYSRSGLGIPAITAINEATEKYIDGDLLGGTLKLITSFVTPAGGAQIQKTVEGIGNYVRGGVYTEPITKVGSNKGKLKYPIAHNAENMIKTATLGAYSTNEGKRYLKEMPGYLSENDTFVYNKMSEIGADTNEVYNALREMKKYAKELGEQKAERESKLRGKPVEARSKQLTVGEMRRVLDEKTNLTPEQKSRMLFWIKNASREIKKEQ